MPSKLTHSATETQAARLTRDQCFDTHWSYHDAPHMALCGAFIKPRQFASIPTCWRCLRELRQMQDEDEQVKA